MTHPNARQKELARAARRREVAALILAGARGQASMATQLGVDQSTISRDLRALEAQWAHDARQDIAVAKGIDLARIDRALEAIWEQVIAGELRAIPAMVRLLERRAKLLGLDAPSHSVLSGGDDGPITVDVRAEAAHELSPATRRLAERLASVRGISVDEVIANAERMLAEIGDGDGNRRS